MTKIKLCGLRRYCDIEVANELLPDFIGFVFVPKSKRYVTYEEALTLRAKLDKRITPVGVFVNETLENIETFVKKDIIRIVQLHGTEDNTYIRALKSKVDCPVIQAFRIESKEDVDRAEKSEADYIMLDSGGGMGTTFDHSLIKNINRDFFLAGGLTADNVQQAICKYQPYAVDASSSLEIGGVKDKEKMTAFVRAVRNGKEEGK